jgi:hypothetical protein
MESILMNDMFGDEAQSSRRDFFDFFSYPAMNRWAIITNALMGISIN